MRFPVVLEDFHIEHGSGGKGKWKAGDGTRRVIRFRETMDCAVLSSHRHVPPPGVDGGEPGRLGKAEVRRSSGEVETLRSCDQTVLEPGEAIIITTPTGGGTGPPKAASPFTERHPRGSARRAPRYQPEDPSRMQSQLPTRAGIELDSRVKPGYDG
jgi:N-methylhydantoinase B/oxoprolinase/acetone carboxylase alpha subunit